MKDSTYVHEGGIQDLDTPEVFWSGAREVSRNVHEQLEFSRRTGFLRDQIERYFALAQDLPEGSKQRRVMERTVEGFARDYMQHTGQPYIRDWEDKSE